MSIPLLPVHPRHLRRVIAKWSLCLCVAFGWSSSGWQDLEAVACVGVLQEADANEKDQPKDDEVVPSIADWRKELEKSEGYFNFYWDARKGQMFLEIPADRGEFLYVHSLATGLGSNPVGLDRGQLGDEKVVHFDRVGPKVLMIERNLRYRAVTDNDPEREAVEQSFAQSVLWGGKVVAEDKGKAYVVNITDLLMTDVHGVKNTLSSTDQGDFSLDENRSAPYLPRCKAFPKNTEFEATLTFTSSKPGRLVVQTAPTSKAVSLRQHHSFVELPDDAYVPREYDARCPSMAMTFADYASPIDTPLQKRWILRHRLIKKNPELPMSEAVEPIVYYVDAGAPQLIRNALIEGASWWNQAFESAGFKNAFQVRVLPPGADPLDVRFNVIQWVHRSTRGWSYGGSVTDPRTGEIIKGHVSLGSLRVRQDHLLVAGLDSGAAPQNPTAPNQRCECCGVGMLPIDSALASVIKRVDPVDVALARIRQLSAHEVGHTLGFVHNFAASTYADRASVMDYPAPRVRVGENDQLDFSDAYGNAIGEWDKISVRFAYTQFANPENEAAGLEAILAEAARKNMSFVSDADSRPAGAAHPLGNLWDNGSDPLTELEHVLNVRRIALQRFDLGELPNDLNSADLQQYLVPIFLHHRYQLNAVGKLLGGVYYEYGGINNSRPPTPVPFEQQVKAFRALVMSMSPQTLLVNPELFDQIGVKPYGQLRDQENFSGKTGRVFDPLAPARVAISLAAAELFQPDRLARFVNQTRDQQKIDLKLIMTAIPGQIQAWINEAKTKDALLLTQIARSAVLEHLIKLANNPNASIQVRSAALTTITEMQNQATIKPDEAANLDKVEASFREYLVRRVNQYFLQPYKPAPAMPAVEVPPGSPIGN